MYHSSLVKSPDFIAVMFLAGMVMISGGGVARAEVDASRASLLEAASRKREAIIVARSGDYQWFGSFIDQEGLAVLDLGCLGNAGNLSFRLVDGTELKAPRIRVLDTENNLAFATFKHRPKVWLEPREEAVRLKDRPVAILSPTGPPMIGPVWARASYSGGNNIRLRFRTVMHVVSGRPPGTSIFAQGLPVVDMDGKLCGVFVGGRPLKFQRLLIASPSDLWFGKIAKARESTEEIPVPLSLELNPLDPASAHPEFGRAVEAMAVGRSEQAARHVENALKEFPGSPLLKRMRWELAIATGNGDLPALTMEVKPPEDAGNAERAFYLGTLGDSLWQRDGDLEGAARAYLAAIAASPDDYWPPRAYYSELMMQMGRWDSALRYTREALRGSPENLELLYQLKSLLGRQQKWDEEQGVTEEIDRIEVLLLPNGT